jgi:hypoxanthine-DNA glycosylase
MSLEYHPFGSFIPESTQYLVVGTFPGRHYAQRSKAENDLDEMAFSYAGRNQFWRIMEKLYGVELVTKQEKKALFESLNIGFMDLIHACRRKNQTNLDTDLTDIVWNKDAFEAVFRTHTIEAVFCTGKGVAQVFQKWFPDQKCIALPSPSPLYAAMRFEEKVLFYKNVFPNT